MKINLKEHLSLTEKRNAKSDLLLVGNEIAEDVQLSEIQKKVWLLFFRVLQVSAFSG